MTSKLQNEIKKQKPFDRIEEEVDAQFPPHRGLHSKPVGETVSPVRTDSVAI